MMTRAQFAQLLAVTFGELLTPPEILRRRAALFELNDPTFARLLCSVADALEAARAYVGHRMERP